MATLARQQITLDGLNVALVAASETGDKLAPGEQTFLLVQNESGAEIDVTVDRVRPSNTGEDDDLVVPVPNNGVAHIGPLPASWFAGSDGLVSVTYEDHTDVDVAAIHI